jgi:RNA polymerase-binding transcription factor DksA
MTKKNKSDKKNGFRVVRIPQYLLEPVGRFLHDQVRYLEKTRKDIDTEDPFRDTDRVMDNASPDTDAAEQFGHARASAIKEQLDRKIVQTRKALSRVKLGAYGICEDCGKMIDTDRLMIYPEATLCASCQKKREK